MGNEVIFDVDRDEDGWPSEQAVMRKRAAAAKLGVTPARYNVLELLIDGYTNEEIAERLALSTETIKSHVKMLLAISYTPTRAGLVGWAFRHDIVF